MAYDKHTWTCNEPITVERLNHIEDGIANAGDCDCGYECTETLTTLTEESVTTELDGDIVYGSLSYSQLINQDTITVTFNGTEYECEVVKDGSEYLYGASYGGNPGAWDWSEYPFQISSYKGSNGVENNIATETAGTYSIKIEGMQEVATTTPCFEKAVKSVMGEVVAHMTEVYDSSTECTTYTLDITDDDVRQIVESGSKLKIIDEFNGVYYPVNIWAKDATPALRTVGQSTAKITIILNATPLTLGTTTNDSTPRYLYATVCPSSN